MKRKTFNKFLQSINGCVSRCGDASLPNVKTNKKNSNQVEICESLCIVGNVKVFNQYKTNTDMYILKPIITEITKCIFFPRAIIDFLSANSIGF